MRTLITIALLGSMLASGPAGAQMHGSEAAHERQGHAHSHREAQACEDSFDKVIAEGRGFGMAFAADRNGYPGPLHVLELREALNLTRDQEARVRTLQAAMFAESRPKSAALLEAEARLGRLFQTGRATEDAVRVQVAEVERLRTEVRLVHLLYHLRTRDVLSEEQRAIYHNRRWAAGPGR